MEMVKRSDEISLRSSISSAAARNFGERVSIDRDTLFVIAA